MSEMTKVQLRMLDVLHRNGNHSMNIGLAELTNEDFCGLIKCDFVRLWPAINGVVFTNITEAGRRALTETEKD